MTCSFTDNDIIATIGVGPKNLETILPSNVAAYTVDVLSYDWCELGTISDCEDISELNDYLGDPIYRANFVVEDACTPFEPVTVSFMNQYGVKDYYTFDRRNTRTVNTTRNEYDKTLGTWNQTSFAIRDYDRGRTAFSSQVQTEMTISTNWMDDATSKWLEELFVSPHINIYTDGKWEPCTIVTGSYEQKTYSREGMFQHQITVRFANNKKVQRG